MSGRLLLLTALLVSPIIVWGFTSSNQVPPDGLRLPPEVTHAAYMGYGLSQNELDSLTSNFAGLEPTRRVMRERADAHLLCYIPGQSRPKVYAVFLYEKIIFEGYDSQSWLIQGQGGRALVHKMNIETEILLDRYAKEAEAQAKRRRLGGKV